MQYDTKTQGALSTALLKLNSDKPVSWNMYVINEPSWNCRC